MTDTIAKTRGTAAGATSQGTSSDTFDLMLTIHRGSGTIQEAAGIVNGEPKPVVDDTGKPVCFKGWHHQDILISNTPRTQLSREGDCPPGYTSKIICGISCCVPIG
ncbi:MAG: hypothetical protein P8164_08625 [Gammaproteobacteria bacterium]